MTVAYVEPSALVKLAIRELESPQLRSSLASHDHLVSSDLSSIEVTRAAWRLDGQQGLARARAALLQFDSVPIDRQIVDAAIRLAPPSLRSLDAIHVATAIGLVSEDVTFYSYDLRALQAASDAGLSVASPRP